MQLLAEAVRRGKEVLAVLELKARFDEEANINSAELEALGAQVVYGVLGLKTHAKMLLITRRESAAASSSATATCPPAITTCARRACTRTSAS